MKKSSKTQSNRGQQPAQRGRILRAAVGVVLVISISDAWADQPAAAWADQPAAAWADQPAAAWADQPAAGPTRRLPKRLPTVARVTNPEVQHANPGARESKSREQQATPLIKTCSLALDAATTNNVTTNNLPESSVALQTTWPGEPSSSPSVARPQRWLRSTTSTASSEIARRLLAQASDEYRVRAWLSAEDTAWDALHWAAESIDLAQREAGQFNTDASALEKLDQAKLAIREARDFSGVYGNVDGDAIARMARSHQTEVLKGQPTNGLSATDASDLYLDEARVGLAKIASRSVEAAQAMDLLAAIHLSRADAKTLPSATALCLRRAALQGQPGNASLATRLGMHLADLGLLDESRWALEHSLSIEHDPQAAQTLVSVLRRTGRSDQAAGVLATLQRQYEQGAVQPSQPPRPRIPDITELSPADFAALSQPVMPAARDRTQVIASLASSRQNTAVTTTAQANAPTITDAQITPATELIVQPPEAKKTGLVRRFIKSFKQLW